MTNFCCVRLKREFTLQSTGNDAGSFNLVKKNNTYSAHIIGKLAALELYPKGLIPML